MKLATISVTLFASSIFAGSAIAAPPAFWHWYYPYAEPVQTCGQLLKETMENIDQNWDLNRSSIQDSSASFVSGDTRGFLRCLNRGSGNSWVVIITSGGGNKAKTMFNDMKVVICGNC